MSEDQKLNDAATPSEDAAQPDGPKLPGPLPGLGGAPSKAPLPGLGGAPSRAPLPGLGGLPSKAPLPGLGGAPSKAPLPGLGGLPSKAPLPGLGQKPAAVMPAFLQKNEPEPAPKGPTQEEIARDPFGHAQVPSTTAVRPSYAPNEGLIGDMDGAGTYSESDAGRSKKPMLIGGAIVFVISLLFGFMMGNGKSHRVELNIAIRDALIVKYEIEKTGKIFNDVQAIVGAALSKTQNREYDDQHVSLLSSKVQGNPIRPLLFTERNYKRFDALAVQWLMDYNKKWHELDKLIQVHRMKTMNDETALKAAKGELEKIIGNGYGVVFARNKQADGALEANVVVVSPGEKSGALKVQAANGTFGDERQIYNPEGPDSKLTEKPDEYVILLGQASKMGLLANASQSHYQDYATRLKEMADLMRGMNELQTNLIDKINKLASQDPVAFGSVDPEEELEKYISDSSKGAASAE